MKSCWTQSTFLLAGQGGGSGGVGENKYWGKDVDLNLVQKPKK